MGRRRAGAITGAQWLYAKNYVQVVGFIDQTQVNLNAQDEGGELDPHGDDEQGNPLGGIVFTNGFGQNAAAFAQQINSDTNNTATPTQVIEWVDFIGSNMFCLKMCNPTNPNAAQLCNHVYDEIDDMAPPGIFTTAPGQTTTWFQPFSGTFVVPYTTSPLASSNCQTFASTQLYAAAAASVYASASSLSAASVTSGTIASATRTGSATGAAATGNGATAIGAPIAILVGAMFSTMFTVFA
ncbi:hypothetical protein BU17DRAFT_91611 [Hysterangium stoloniferum]|nr:hypothetical protein BU17DRAFT_91611 [Hysterangium stoloniferum]